MANRAKGELACPIITAPVTRGDGWRHLWLGNSGLGKSVANAKLIDWVLKHKKASVVLSLDDKSNFYAQYKGTYRANPRDLRTRMPAIGERKDHIVFRGVALTRKFDDGCSAEDLGKLAQEIVGSSRAIVVVNIDELADATNGGQAWKRGESDEPAIAQVYRKGRGVGICITATTQLPQSLPREAFSLSDTIGFFRLSGREIEYLLRYKVITPEIAAMIPNLQVGEFILYDKNTGICDGCIYKFAL
jgi:hypothetical protein